METMQEWFILPNLPAEFWEPSIIEEIGNRLGTFVYAEERRKSGQFQSHVHICVENNLVCHIYDDIKLILDYGSWIQKLEGDSFTKDSLVRPLGSRISKYKVECSKEVEVVKVHHEKGLASKKVLAQ